MKRFVHNFLKVTFLLLLTTGLSTLNVSYAQHDSDSHSGGHKGGRGGGDHGSGHDSDEGHGSGHSGYRGGGRHGGSYGGHGHRHDVARDVGHSLENRIFRGRRPVWAREGIPEVELGRLNVARAPDFVLSRAEHKALEEYSAAMAELYNLSAEEAAQLITERYNEILRIHSPVQNLALYRDVMTFEQSQLPGVIPASTYDLAAIFLGSAADKNIPITQDTIIAVNRILGLVEMSDDNIQRLATKADSVRSAILSGHGETTHTDPVTH